MKPTEIKNLSWKDAFWYLLDGKRIKRPLWKGYWAWENNTIMMHCRDGSVTDIRHTDFPAYTFSNIAQRDWMVTEDDVVTEDDEEQTTSVKHGKWIDQGVADCNGNRSYICSECQHQDTHTPEAHVRYCWSCGARMDGEDEIN